MLEQEWLDHGNDLGDAMEASFYLVAFCCALRGVEVGTLSRSACNFEILGFRRSG